MGDRAARVRIAHAGCGAWGRNLVRELAAHSHVDLALVVDPDPEARAFAKRMVPGVATATSMAALGEHDIDAVTIATPGPLHARHAMAALTRGAHVFVEKPMTTSAADARALINRGRSAGKIGMVGHLLHHHGAVRAMLRVVREGRIGTPREFRSARLCQHGSRDADGSLLWSLAPHDMSVLRALDPKPVRQMQVDLRAAGDGAAPSIADLHLRLAGGLRAHIVVSRAHPSKVRRMEVVGDEGAVVFDDLGWPALSLRSRGRREALSWDESVPPLRAEVDAFVTCVRDGLDPAIGFDEGLAVVELIERAHAVASSRATRPALSAAR